MRNIKQNLFWAFVYNIALIPIAAGAVVSILGHPVITDVCRKRDRHYPQCLW